MLDVYGTPTQLMKTGDGPGHFVVTGDFDGELSVAVETML
jgi:hypothetical protein